MKFVLVKLHGFTTIVSDEVFSEACFYHHVLMAFNPQVFTINDSNGICDRVFFIFLLLRSLFLVKLQAFSIICYFARLIKLTHIQSVATNLKNPSGLIETAILLQAFKLTMGHSHIESSHSLRQIDASGCVGLAHCR